MSKAKKSATQERLAREQAERDAKMAKQKAVRLAAEGKNKDALEQSAKRVAALYKSMREFEAHAEEKAGFELKKAAEKRAALEQALVEARALCKAAGESFKAFKEKYAPNYGRTKLYQILAIADGRTTVEDVREEEREKKRRQRAGKVSGTKDVPDDSEPKTEAPAAPVIEAIKAKGAALDLDAPTTAPTPPAADLSIPEFMRRTADEAPAGEKAPAEIDEARKEYVTATDEPETDAPADDGEYEDALRAVQQRYASASPEEQRAIIERLVSDAVYGQNVLYEFLARDDQKQVARDIIDLVGWEWAQGIQFELESEIENHEEAERQCEEGEEESVAEAEEYHQAKVSELAEAEEKLTKAKKGKAKLAAERAKNEAKRIANNAEQSLWIANKAAELRAERAKS